MIGQGLADYYIHRTIKKRQITQYVFISWLCKIAFIPKCLHASQDSDTNPNTTASSVAGDTMQHDGRKRRSEATQLRKSVFGKKHNRLDESKVGHLLLNDLLLQDLY